MTEFHTDPGADLGDRAFTALQHLLPKRLLSRLIYSLMRIESPLVKRALIASFLRSGVTLPAVREGETFVVEVPLTAGHYTVRWTAVGEDGSALASDDPALTVTRKVEPVRRIQNAYPGR